MNASGQLTWLAPSRSASSACAICVFGAMYSAHAPKAVPPTLRHPLPPLPCSPFDTKQGLIVLGLTVASGGGWLLSGAMQLTKDPRWLQLLQLLIVFWCELLVAFRCGLLSIPVTINGIVTFNIPFAALSSYPGTNRILGGGTSVISFNLLLLPPGCRLTFVGKTTWHYVRLLEERSAAALAVRAQAATVGGGDSSGTPERPTRQRRTRRA